MAPTIFVGTLRGVVSPRSAPNLAGRSLPTSMNFSGSRRASGKRLIASPSATARKLRTRSPDACMMPSTLAHERAAGPRERVELIAGPARAAELSNAPAALPGPARACIDHALARAYGVQ